ncbi:MAG: RsmE family RNA methyltransferase [Bacteroidota bacterium]
MSALPLFYQESVFSTGSEFWLDEDTARHIVQVLRMPVGAILQLTDGNGAEANATITIAEKKKCKVLITHIVQHAPRHAILHLAVAFTKNTSRNEWLLEKATELGIASITPLITARTERERIRYDRWKGILVAAIIQSQQYHLPTLNEASTLQDLIQKCNSIPQKLIGHCIDNIARVPLADAMKPKQETIILIGPEGDFTQLEVDSCMQHGYKGILMGNTRLRTETAAMAACAYFNLIDHD